MEEYIFQFLIAIGPALVTGGLAYWTASKKSKNDIETVKIQADKELERLEKENKAKFEDLEKEREHDLKKLKEERAADLEYYKGQLEVQAKYDETMMINNYANKAMGDLYEKYGGDLNKINEAVNKLDDTSQADKARQLAKKKKRK